MFWLDSPIFREIYIQRISDGRYTKHVRLNIMLKTTAICIVNNPDRLLAISKTIHYFVVFHYGCRTALFHSNGTSSIPI